MNETDMLRVSKELKTKLKHKAKAEGRTLEWMANDALSEYLLTKDRQANPPLILDTTKPIGDPKRITQAPQHYKPTDDWGA